MLSFLAGVRPSSPAPSSRHLTISSQHLLGEARAHQAMGNVEEAKKSYSEAVNKAKTEYEKKPGDLQAKKAFDVTRNEFFTFLNGLQEPAAAADVGEHSPTSLIQNQLPLISQNDATIQRPLSAQRAQDASKALSNEIKPDFFERRLSLSELGLNQIATHAEKKNAQVEYLFEKALSTLSSLELPNRPSLFLVYAHDNPSYGKAEAAISKYLIDQLSQIQVNLYSDRTPMGPSFLRASEDWKKDGKLEDILTSQLCLLPTRLRDDVEPVDKVVVCCSEVLEKYLDWTHYGTFYRELREAYRKDCEQKGTSAIREVVKKFSQEAEYKAGFHHVLTEIAFLQIRAEQRRDQHGIIPVSLALESAEQCLGHFIASTTVRMEDISRFEEEVKAGREVYLNQGQHLVLFKLIERLLVGSDEAQTFLNKFWQGYDKCISLLNKESSKPDELEFTKLVDSIFGGIDKTLRDQLVLATLQQHKDRVEKLRLPNLSNLREALYQHYQLSNLSIQRVSGKTASLDDCYINLAIVESYAQREKDKEELGKQATTFERLPSSEPQRLEATNPNKLIALDKLFEAQKLRDGSEGMPKRILIQGRAGIGKTTLCKKLVYEYYRNGLWQDIFDNILWVPLRQLKTASQATSIHCLEDLLCQRYFSNHGNAKAQALGKTFLEYQNKTLFILDGLDEVTEIFSENHPLNHFLKHLLNQPRVLITSRPAGVDASQCNELDLELETIGFSSENIQTYIEKFVPKAEDQAEIGQFIDRTPLIQSLVNIPIQLDALCYSWNSLPKNQTVTMASLYEAMVSKLWSKDSKRLEKRKSEEKLIAYKLKERIAPEDNYLSYLAFKGLEAGKIEFSWEDLSICEEELYKTGGIDTDTYKLKVTSFLHTADAEEPDEEKRSYHFLHLTFQEFFAAKFLVKYLQAYTNVERTSVYTYGEQKNLDVMPTRHDVETFIATHKYHPRYEIVWWMVAGLLKGAALENFFNVFNQSPQDLIGIRHQQVMVGCLNEARPELKDKIVETLETRLKQYFELEIKLIGQSQLGRHMLFPEHLLITSLSSDRDKDEIIKILRARPNLSVNAILALIDIALKGGSWEFRKTAARILYEQKVLPANALQALIDASEDNDKDVRSAAVRALGGQSTLSEVVVLALIGALKDQDSDVRSAAAHALGGQSTLSEAVVLALIGALKDQNSDVKYAAAHGLEGQSTLSETIVLALISALNDQDEYVRSAVNSALRGQSTLSDTVERALIDALKGQDMDVREGAVCALRRQSALSKAVVLALIDALKDQDEDVRSAAAHVLMGQSVLSEVVVLALIDALKDQDSNVRSTAVSALGSRGRLSEAVVRALIDALKDQDSNVRYAAVSALGSRGRLSEAIVQALIDALKDQDSDVRYAAARALGGQSALSEAVMQALIDALKDENWNVRYEAASALGGQSTLSDAAVLALIDALKDQNSNVRDALVMALRSQGTFSEAIVPALIDALKDQDSDVRSSAARALGGQSALSEAVILALIDALKDKDSDIRSAAVHALGGQSTLSEAIVLALSDALKDQHWNVRDAADNVLRGQSMLSEAAARALIYALKYQDSNVRYAAVRVLRGQSALSEAVILALSDALKDQNWNVRYAAARALGGQSALSEAVMQALIDALKDQHWNVRYEAASALGGQSTLSDAAVLALIDALKDQHSNVRDEAASALGGQSALSEAAVRALIGTLKDQHSNVRSAVARALGNQSMLSETAVLALIDALKDQDSNVRSEAIRALKEEELLPADTIVTLITMLEDEDKSIKEMIIKILVEQKKLSTNVIQALITKLIDRDKSVRDAVVGILDLHIDQIYSMFASLTSKQIQILYAKALFLQSAKQIMLLYSHGNRLYFYTKNGLKHIESMPVEKMNVVVEAFEAVRRNPEIIYVQESTSINAAAFSVEITNESDTNRVLGSNHKQRQEVDHVQESISASCMGPMSLIDNAIERNIIRGDTPVSDEPIDNDYFLEEGESDFSSEEELTEDED